MAVNLIPPTVNFCLSIIIGFLKMLNNASKKPFERKLSKYIFSLVIKKNAKKKRLTEKKIHV